MSLCHYEFADGGPLPLPDMRAWLRACLFGRRPEVVQDAALLVTELISNAHEHADGVKDLRLYFPADRDVVRIEVDDTGGVVAQPQVSLSKGTRGRGLRLVDAISSAWGVVRGARHKKTVWAELSLS